MNLRDLIRSWQGRLGFINRLPSWLNELLSGFLCVGLASGLLVFFGWLISLVGVAIDLRGVTFPLAFVLSEVYEHVFDPWGWNPSDVVERMRGIVLLMLIVAAIT